MRRFASLMLCGVVSCFVIGCDGEDQPNAPAEVVNEDLAKQASDMMREANASMEKKARKKSKGAAARTPAPSATTPTTE